MSNQSLPAVPYLKIPEGGEPYLEGQKCGQCGTTFLGERSVCSKCGARDQMSAVTLPNSGKLYSYSIVYRSFPGIEVPYVSAIVDLDDGTAIKGNLIAVLADLKKAKPASAKGIYVRKVTLSTTMGPGVTIDHNAIDF